MAIKFCIVRESKDRLSSTCRCNFGTSLYWGFLKYLWCVIEPWVTILFYCNIICVEQCVPDIGHSSCLCNLDFFISKTPSWICEKCVGSACTQNQIVDIEDVEKRAARFVRLFMIEYQGLWLFSCMSYSGLPGNSVKRKPDSPWCRKLSMEI